MAEEPVMMVVAAEEDVEVIRMETGMGMAGKEEEVMDEVTVIIDRDTDRCR